MKLERENNARDRVLESEEFIRLQVHSAPNLQVINLMAYQIRMRWGEILHVTWDRVDFIANVIRLLNEDTRMNEGRLVPSTPKLTILLKDRYKVRYLIVDHVFWVKGHLVNSIKTTSNAACRRASILKDFTFMNFDIRPLSIYDGRVLIISPS